MFCYTCSGFFSEPSFIPVADHDFGAFFPLKVHSRAFKNFYEQLAVILFIEREKVFLKIW